MDGTDSGLETRLRVYDADGKRLAAGRTVSPEKGTVRVTVDAERGELLYVAVAALDDSATGTYTVQVTQSIGGRLKHVPAH